MQCSKGERDPQDYRQNHRKDREDDPEDGYNQIQSDPRCSADEHSFDRPETEVYPGAKLQTEIRPVKQPKRAMLLTVLANVAGAPE